MPLTSSIQLPLKPLPGITPLKDRYGIVFQPQAEQKYTYRLYHNNTGYITVMVSPNMLWEDFPNLLPEREDISSRRGEFIEPNHLKYSSIKWHLSGHVSLPFVPICRRSSSLFLQQFDYTYRTIPVSRELPGYILRHDLAQSWRRAETMIIHAHTKLSQGRFLSPISQESAHTPSTYNYFGVFKAEREIRYAANKALLAFREHLAKLSHAIARVGPHWVDALHHHCPMGPGLSHSDIDVLAQSGVDNFSCADNPRAGVIFRAEDIQEDSKLRLPLYWEYVRASVPVMVELGTIKMNSAIRTMGKALPEWRSTYTEQEAKSPLIFAHSMPTIFKMLMEIYETVKSVLEDAFDGDISPIHIEEPHDSSVYMQDSHGSATPTIDNPALYPDPVPNSCQEYGVDWCDFFHERRITANSTSESQSDVITHQALYTLALAMNKPGIQPPPSHSVYVWRLSDTHTGFYLRYPVPHTQVHLYWDLYYPGQRLYTYIFGRHEWDLHALLDIEAGDENEGSYVIQRAEIHKQYIDTHHSKEHLSLHRTSVTYTLLPQDNTKLLIQRYGLYECVLPTAIPLKVDPNLLLGIFEDNPMSNDLKNCTIYLAATLTQKRCEALNLKCLDIVPGSRMYLGLGSSLRNIRPIALRRAGSTPAHAYHIVPTMPSSEVDFPWLFIVTSASSAVLACRMGWTATRDLLVRQFFLHGIPFHTLRPQVGTFIQRPITLQPVSIDPLPNYSLTFEDFEEYEKKRERFFSSPQGKALVQYGGTLRRLYMSDVGAYEHRIQSIIEGPTLASSVRSHNQYTLSISGSPDIQVYEDCLSDLEERYLSGAYSANGTLRVFS